MSAASIFVFGIFVFAAVCAALGAIVRGFVEDRRSRTAIGEEPAPAARPAGGGRPLPD
jgi:hypothetical protein